jgi:hypothetical protein
MKNLTLCKGVAYIYRGHLSFAMIASIIAISCALSSFLVSVPFVNLCKAPIGTRETYDRLQLKAHYRVMQHSSRAISQGQNK